MAAQKTRPPNFKITIPGGDDKKQVLLSKMKTVREILVSEKNHPVSNWDILEHALDELISLHMEGVPTPKILPMPENCSHAKKTNIDIKLCSPTIIKVNLYHILLLVQLNKWIYIV